MTRLLHHLRCDAWNWLVFCGGEKRAIAALVALRLAVIG